MFRNSTKSVGTIIKLIAAILFCIDLLLGIIGAIVLFCLDDDFTLLGILTIILTPLSSILMYLFLYGFGQLVENSDYLVQEHKKAQDNPDNQTTGNTPHFTPVAAQNLIIGDWKDRQISVCIYDNFAFSFKGTINNIKIEEYGIVENSTVDGTRLFTFQFKNNTYSAVATVSEENEMKFNLLISTNGAPQKLLFHLHKRAQ